MTQPEDDLATLVRATAREYLLRKCDISTVRAALPDLGGLVERLTGESAALGWPDVFAGDDDAPADGLPSAAQASVMVALAEELGRALFPAPVISSGLVARVLAASGSQTSFLEGLAGGSLSAALALGPAAAGLQATAADGGCVVSGTVPVVPDGADADLVLVSGHSAGHRVDIVIPLELPGVRATRLDALDLTRRFARVEFEAVRVPRELVLERLSHSVSTLETLLLCAETIGAVERTLEFTLDYAKTRIAFGRPIGGFQALKHRFADMLLAIESAKAAVDAAVAASDAPGDVAAESAAAAGVYVARQLPSVVRDCVQIHGGIGFTWEHDIHLYLRRVESNVALLRAAGRHEALLARSLGLSPAAGAASTMVRTSDDT